MKQRPFGLTLLAVIWASVLLVPLLRTMLQVQVQGSDVLPAPTLNGTMNWGPGDMLYYQRLALRYPQDAQVQAKAIEEATQRAVVALGQALPQASMATIQERQRVVFHQELHQYDALMQRFPGQPWLIANRLRLMTRAFLDNRVEENLEAATQASRGNHPPSMYSDTDLEQAIALAQRGQQLEPDNSFYDWIAAQCLFGLHRDGEALATLHQAAQKSNYDPHVKDDMLATLNTHELVRPLLSEEKLFILAAELLPQYAGHRHTARLAVGLGVAAEQAGDHQRALEIYHDVARLGSLIRQHDYYAIGALVGVAIEATAWAGKERKLPTEGQQKSDQPKGAAVKALPQRFAFYATLHGRPDIATQTLHEGEAAAQMQQLVAGLSASDTFFGIPARSFEWLFNSLWSGKLLLAQLLLNVMLWLGLAAAVRYGTAPQPEPVNWLDVTSTLIVSSCVMIALVGLALFWGAGWNQWSIFASAQFGYAPLIRIICNLAILSPAVLGAILCLCGIVWRQRLNGWRSSVHYGLRCYQQMIGAFIVLSSVVYLCLGLASLPARHVINIRLDTGIQQGELALLQARQGKA